MPIKQLVIIIKISRINNSEEIEKVYKGDILASKLRRE